MLDLLPVRLKPSFAGRLARRSRRLAGRVLPLRRGWEGSYLGICMLKKGGCAKGGSRGDHWLRLIRRLDGGFHWVSVYYLSFDQQSIRAASRSFWDWSAVAKSDQSKRALRDSYAAPLLFFSSLLLRQLWSSESSNITTVGANRDFERTAESAATTSTISTSIHPSKHPLVTSGLRMPSPQVLTSPEDSDQSKVISR